MFGKVVSKIKELKNRVTRKKGKILVQGEHEYKRTLEIDVFYPDHPPRTESSTYKASRKHLIDELGLVCEICKTSEHLETHHMFCEWADADAVDWDKMRKIHPTFDWSTFKGPEDFVDSVYNLVVLCATHHRGKNHGIHAMPFPNWQAQAFMKDDFILSEDEAEKFLQ